MNETDYHDLRMAVDLKKYRFRIHRGTLHALGDPAQVQLMFDPGKKALMLMVPSISSTFGQEEKVIFDKPGHDGSFQLYSMTLIQKIQKIFPALEDQTSYWLIGKLIPSIHAVYFPLNSFCRIENNEARTNGNTNHHRQRIQEPDPAFEK